MFDFKPETLAYFAAYRAQRAEAGKPADPFTEADLARIEKIWGYPLPEAYRALMAMIGPMPFPDEGQCIADVTYHEGEMQHGFTATLGGLMDVATLELVHRHMIEDPDNDDEAPFFPPNMLAFASDVGDNVFLLELGVPEARVWFWEDQPDAWQSGDNTRLGFVAPDLPTFIAELK